MAISSIKSVAAVAVAKSKLQALGISATDLRRRTMNTLTLLKSSLVKCDVAVDVVDDVGKLRDIATIDPFDSSTRDVDSSRVPDISAKASKFLAKFDRRFTNSTGRTIKIENPSPAQTPGAAGS
jgi:hypothetical protein